MAIKTTLSKQAAEDGSFIIQATFKDEDDVAVIPNAGLIWSLTDKDGTVINSREDVSIVSASTINIVLSGDDLQIVDQDCSEEERRVIVEGAYDGSLGSDLPIKSVAVFMVVNLIKVT